MSRIADISAQMSELRAKKDFLEEKKSAANASIAELTTHLENSKKAQILIQKAARQTQEGIEYHIAHTVTHAVQTIFGHDIEFGVEFVERRGQVECDLYYIEHGERLDILDDAGGGVVDSICFALRLVLWSMNKTRPTLLIDEGFKFVSKDLIFLVTEMLKQFKDTLGMQFIMVTHIQDFIENADKGYVVKQGNCIST